MGFARLLKTEAALATFRTKFNIPLDVDIEYCYESSIENDRRPQVVFFPLMAILERGVRFPVGPLLLRAFRFYCLWPNQLPPNFYRVVSCVSRHNNLYDLHLNHHDINLMYSMCGNKRSRYYLKIRDTMVQLISCLTDSNRNSAGEYVKVPDDRLADKLTRPTSPWEIGRYPPSILFSLFLFSFYYFYILMFPFVHADTKHFKPNPNAIHV